MSSEQTFKSKKKKKRKNKPIPLVPPAMKSRKKARVVTSLYHKYTKERDAAKAKKNGALVKELNSKIEAIGGVTAYQQASQLSTSFFSTSKWVLGYLSRNGWIHGIVLKKKPQIGQQHPHRRERRTTRVLEVGAINTELLDAASEMSSQDGLQVPTRKYNIHVRAIDLNSSMPGIEEQDFLTLPIQNPKYDVIVCSMVINCVTTPEARGTMLLLLYQQCCPGGLVFLTLPKLCLTASPYMNKEHMQSLLTEGVGFVITETKETPKVAFFVLLRPDQDKKPRDTTQFAKKVVMHRGKKYRQSFAVCLNPSRKQS